MQIISLFSNSEKIGHVRRFSINTDNNLPVYIVLPIINKN